MGERRGRRGEEGRGEDQGGDERRTRGEREREMMMLDSRGDGDLDGGRLLLHST
jgi:hypothetical protein